jgi:hypothetical protein
MKTKTPTPTLETITLHVVKMICSGDKMINIAFSDREMAREFYDYHKNFMVFLRQPIKKIELLS